MNQLVASPSLHSHSFHSLLKQVLQLMVPRLALLFIVVLRTRCSELQTKRHNFQKLFGRFDKK